jgi:hypothetical protein
VLENSQKSTEEIRNRVIFFLLFLTSEKCIEACSKFITPEKLIFKLSKIWCNDIFVPGRVFIDAVKNDYSEKSSRIFQDCFDIEEYDVLERFHIFFDLRLNMLSEKSKNNAEFPVTDMWENILKDARYVLDEITPDQKKLRIELEQKVDQALENNKNILDGFL